MSSAGNDVVFLGSRPVKRITPTIRAAPLPPRRASQATATAAQQIDISDDEEEDEEENQEEALGSRQCKRPAQLRPAQLRPAQLRPAPLTRFDDDGESVNESIESSPSVEQLSLVQSTQKDPQATRIHTTAEPQRSVLDTRNVLRPRNESIRLQNARVIPHDELTYPRDLLGPPPLRPSKTLRQATMTEFDDGEQLPSPLDIKGAPSVRQPGAAPQVARTPINGSTLMTARQQVDGLDDQPQSFAPLNSETSQSAPAAQPIEQRFLFKEPLSRKMIFDSYTGVYNIDRAPMDVPMNSIIAYIVGKNRDLQGKRTNSVAVFFAKNSRYNRTLPQTKESFVDHCLVTAPIALAAKFALDMIVNMTKSEGRFKRITHIVLCTDINRFLSILDDWKWIYQDIMWTLTKKDHGRWRHTDYPQVCSLLAKLVDLRGEFFQVSFHKADAREMRDAYEMIQGLGASK